MDNGKNKILSIILIAAIVLCFSFAGGLAGAFMYNQKYGANVPGNEEPISNPTNQGDITITPAEDITIAEAVAKKVMPSVVGISTVSTQTSSGFDGFDFFFGFGGGGGYSYDTTAIGTGVIVDEAGYILTNSHVVNDGVTKSITVSLYDGKDVEGKVLWNDATLDLAVVKIESENLQAAELADSDLVNIGSYAAAIGNPLGLQFERSISQGIISGLDRTIAVSANNGSGSTTMEGLMQTDATINGGNSGGPLLNAEGKVIAINTAKASDGEGMGFAIPINVAAPIVAQIKETGTFVRAYIGISGIGLDEQTQYSSQQLLDNFGTDKGIYVSQLTEGGGAQDAGIKQGDIITKVDGIEVGTMNKINKIMVSHKVGDKVQVEFVRDKKTKTCEVTLTAAKLTISK